MTTSSIESTRIVTIGVDGKSNSRFYFFFFFSDIARSYGHNHNVSVILSADAAITLNDFDFHFSFFHFVSIVTMFRFSILAAAWIKENIRQIARSLHQFKQSWKHSANDYCIFSPKKNYKEIYFLFFSFPFNCISLKCCHFYLFSYLFIYWHLVLFTHWIM